MLGYKFDILVSLPRVLSLQNVGSRYSVACPYYEQNINFLLTESAVVTVKYQTEVLTIRDTVSDRGLDSTDRARSARSLHKSRGLIFSRNDQAVEVNKRFIIWLFKQHTLHTYSVT